MTERINFSDDELKEYTDLRIKISDLYYEFVEQNKVSPNELHIHSSSISTLFKFAPEKVKENRFDRMLIITNPNPEVEVDLKVSFNPLSAEL